MMPKRRGTPFGLSCRGLLTVLGRSWDDEAKPPSPSVDEMTKHTAPYAACVVALETPAVTWPHGRKITPLLFCLVSDLIGAGLLQKPSATATVARDVLAGRISLTAVVPPVYAICLNPVVAKKLSVPLPSSVVERAKRMCQLSR